MSADDRRGGSNRSGAQRRGRTSGEGARRSRTTPRAGGRRSSGAPDARRVAYDVIRAVDADEAYANLLLPHRIAEARLTSADAALATELCFGTLRGRGTYDAIIALAADRAADRIDPPVLDVLRLGAHQLLATRVAPHAAVNETVELARAVASRGAAGFVNAVMRTISRTTPEDWRAEFEQRLDGDALVVAETSHPAWIVRALRDALAAESRQDELDALVAADNTSPRVSLAALPGFADPEELLAGDPDRLADADVSPIGLRLLRGDPSAIRAVADGTVRVQDEGSQLVALALAAATPVAGGERWLDLCAGPGGKAALLAALARRDGAELVANELQPARARLVRRALEPLGLGVPVSELDGREIGEIEPSSYDRILVDAPCTGLGALRRRPESRWRKSPGDVGALVAIQEALLDAALAATRPGGVVAYVTCSPHLAETTGVVRRALRRDDVEALDAEAIVLGVARPGLELAHRPLTAPDGRGRGTSVQLWPHRNGTDAMFLALLRRTR